MLTSDQIFLTITQIVHGNTARTKNFELISRSLRVILFSLNSCHLVKITILNLPSNIVFLQIESPK